MYGGADDYAVQTIQNKEFIPIIRNPESKFVVVTYWWGRGNDNKNTQRPCQYDIEELIDDEVESALLEDSEGFRDIVRTYTPLKKSIMEGDKRNVEHAPETLRAWVKIKKLREDALKTYKTDPAFADKYRQLRTNVTNNVFSKSSFTTKQPKRWTRKSRGKRRAADPRSLFGNILDDDYEEPESEQEGVAGGSNIHRRETRRKKVKWCRAPTRNTERPKKFETMIDEWDAMCVEMNVNSVSVEYPEFTVDWPKYYQSAINAKPLFIKKALDICGRDGRGVLYIDGDMFLRKFPKIFEMKNVDIMCQGWTADPRGSPKIQDGDVCVDPFVLETSGGTMYYGNTQTARKLLDAWWVETSKRSALGKADDRILSQFFTRDDWVSKSNIIQLPIEYLWLTDKYDDGRFCYSDATARIQDAIIEHPACLTAEEAAADQGAAVNRTPGLYSQDVYDANICDNSFGHFYEYIFFPSEDMVDTLGPFLTYMKSAKTPEGRSSMIHHSYADKFGGYNAIARANAEKVRILPIITDPQTHTFTHAEATIPNILQYLLSGVNVIIGEVDMDEILPETEAYVGVKYEHKRTWKTRDVRVDSTSDMYFASSNKILRDLFVMCRSLADINQIVNESYMFLSRIRWEFYVSDEEEGQELEDAIAMNDLGDIPVNDARSEIAQLSDLRPDPVHWYDQTNLARRRLTPDHSIRKMIHQIWFGSDIPIWRDYLFKKNEKLAKMRGWGYRLWLESDRTKAGFIHTYAKQQECLEVGRRLETNRWAQVADLARLEIVYLNGGVYFDSLFEISERFLIEAENRIKAVDKVQFMGANEDPGDLECVGSGGMKYLTNSFFGAAADSPILERLITPEALAAIDLESPYINRTTGPYYLRSAILPEDEPVVSLFKTEEIYPFNKQATEYRVSHPDIYLSNQPGPTKIETIRGVFLETNAVEDIRNRYAKTVHERDAEETTRVAAALAEHPRTQKLDALVIPLVIYHSGLGGTWSADTI